ncbi:hypothetical protein [Nannocystis pusilla]|uniref:hypothetical protein n=1 Tax=Nannocystis pusilla TaxID=889268 RepID=UPI003BF2377E
MPRAKSQLSERAAPDESPALLPLKLLADALEQLYSPHQLRRLIEQYFPEQRGELPEASTRAGLAHEVASLAVRSGFAPALVSLSARKRAHRVDLLRPLASYFCVELIEHVPTPSLSKANVARLLAFLAAFIASAAFCVLRTRETHLIAPPENLETTRHGLYRVDAEMDRTTWSLAEPLTLRVRSSHEGFVWIFEPRDGLANPLFPCSHGFPGCMSETPPARLESDTWRTIPHKDDRYQLRAGTQPGQERLVVIVTSVNDPRAALTYLLELCPELSLKADSVRIGDWGATSVSYRVSE